MFVVGNLCVSNDITALNEELRPLRASEGRSVENRQRESTLCVCVCVWGGGGLQLCVCVCGGGHYGCVSEWENQFFRGGGGVKYILGGVRFP